MIKAFIFDFDGLILDTEIACYDTWKEIYEQFNADLPFEEWSKCIGSSDEAFDPVAYLTQKTSIVFDNQRIRAEHQIRYREKTKQLELKPGIKDYLRFSVENGISLAVASSSNRNWVMSHLSDLNILANFDVIFTAEDVERVKPDPALFENVKKSLKLQDYEAIVFEDSYHGITAALAAGCYTVAVPNELTKQLDLSHAHYYIESLAEITPEELLSKFNENI